MGHQIIQIIVHLEQFHDGDASVITMMTAHIAARGAVQRAVVALAYAQQLPLGSIGPDDIHTPGVYVNRIVECRA